MKKSRFTNKKKLIFILSGVLIFTLAVIAVILLLNGPDKSEVYIYVNDAIDKTESLEDFIVEVSSNSQISVDGKIQSTFTSGAISSKDNMNDVYVYLNTRSNTPSDKSSDFDVTVSMYTDGDKVYDDSSKKAVEIDMTPEEFREIVSEYKLYRYNEDDLVKAEFDENNIEEFKGDGNMTITLSKPSDEVLKAYAKKIESVVDENVKIKDLETKSAFITYSVYDDKIKAQTCTFAVEYICKDGKKVYYSVTNQVVYVENIEDLDDKGMIIPETKEEDHE